MPQGRRGGATTTTEEWNKTRTTFINGLHFRRFIFNSEPVKDSQLKNNFVLSQQLFYLFAVEELSSLSLSLAAWHASCPFLHEMKENSWVE